MSDDLHDADNAPPAGPAGEPEELERLRREIDLVDQRLVALISERARVVEAIGRSKRATGYPVYAPHRERQVLDRVLALNPGPLPDRTLEAIYRELMSGSFSLELPPRVGFLGPRGSFSHIAAARHLGASVELVDLHTIEHVFEETAAARCTYGLVPYENSIGGSIADTLHAFQRHTPTICAETLVRVAHALLSNTAPHRIARIYSKPQVFAQCHRWLTQRYPRADRIPTASTAAAAQRAAQEPDAAAIGSTLAAQLYGLNILFEDIQDNPDNITRFLILTRDQQAPPTGRDKTTVMFTAAHKPGALVDVLAVFRDADINLSHIDKCPSRRTNWEYTFFIDCDLHRDDPAMVRALDQARAHCLALRVLGAYPQAQSVLA